MESVSEPIGFVSLNSSLKIKAYTRCYLHNKWSNFLDIWSTGSALIRINSLLSLRAFELASPGSGMNSSNLLHLLYASAYSKEPFNKPKEVGVSGYFRGCKIFLVEDLTVWTWRESQWMLPHFCNKAVIRAFQIRKMDPWVEVVSRIMCLAITAGSHEPTTSSLHLERTPALQ